MRAGDLVVWYTDGVIEAQDPAGEPFGDRRLQRMLRRLDRARLGPPGIHDLVHASVAAHRAGTAARRRRDADRRAMETTGRGVARALEGGVAVRLRVVSYNIHKCIGGVDRRYEPERTAEVLRKLEADVLLLQEVDAGVVAPRESSPDRAARRSGRHCAIAAGTRTSTFVVAASTATRSSRATR